MSRLITFALALAILPMTYHLGATTIDLEDPCVGLNCPLIESFANQPLELDLMLDQSSRLDFTAFSRNQANNTLFQFGQQADSSIKDLLNLRQIAVANDQHPNLHLSEISASLNRPTSEYLSRQTATISLGFQHNLR